MYSDMPEVSSQLEKLDVDITKLRNVMDVHRVNSETIHLLFDLFEELQQMNKYLAAEVDKRTKKRNRN